ncbi:MAG: Reductase [Actinomycetia bacterium]|nr:Reductase [Actinomycetes bacterium]
MLGGTGQIGRAVAPRLAEDGWEVVVASRSGSLPGALAELGVRAAQVDRDVGDELEAAIGDGVDVLVDVVAFTREHGEQLNRLAGHVGSVVTISSASVYADDAGRTLDEAESIETFPRFPVPIPETQRTVAPSDETYSTQKSALEQELLAGPLPVTILRPCAIHGPGSELPRELYFVKRMLDRRCVVVLVSNGENRFHTTSAANLAELVRLAAASPAKRVVNGGDPDPPSVLEIGRAIAAALGHEFEEVLVPETGYERRELSNPWAVPFPLLVDMGLAGRELGYRPVTTYADAVGETCDWLVEEGAHRDWSGTYLGRYFDYAAEDALLAQR